MTLAATHPTAADTFVLEQLVPFREQMIEIMRSKHPQFVAMIETLLKNRLNRIGFRILQEGQLLGDYTFHLNGIHIVETEIDKLASGIELPLMGMIRPYVEIEKALLEAMLTDEEFKNAPFSAAGKYMSGVTLKFLPIL